MWHLTACKISVCLSFLNWIENEMIFYRISELILATLLQRYDKKSFHFKNKRITEMLSDATFYDCINTIYQFIKHLLANKCLFLKNKEPLNKVGVSASMDYKLVEQRSVIKLLLEGKNLAIFFKGCRKVFSKACLSHSTFYSWISQFREDRTRLRDKPRPGQPAKAMTPEMVANDEVFVNKDCRVTLQDVVNQFSICKVLAHQILYEKLGMNEISARWVPKQQTENQNASSVTIAKEYLGCFNNDENYCQNMMKSIVTWDEMWVHYAEPETKAQSEQWK